MTRYDEVAQLLIGKLTARADDGAAWVQELCGALKVPSLAEFGLREEDLPAVVAKSRKSSSMKGNPIALTDDELVEITPQSIRIRKMHLSEVERKRIDRKQKAEGR